MVSEFFNHNCKGESFWPNWKWMHQNKNDDVEIMNTHTHTHARTHAPTPTPTPTHTMLSLQQNLVQIWTKIDKIYRPICRQSPTYTETTQLILIANCVQNNCGRMTFQVKIQVTGLSHYLHLSLAQVFFTLSHVLQSVAWFLCNWNISRKCIKT